ncbi:MAG: DUF3343 domain-containing protein [Bacillota bacterium]|nr:DUF3343 domain-containing protein [Bacillota bacterium]
MFIIVTFESTHQALAAEKVAATVGIPHETIPTPRNISANCGLSIKVPEQYLSHVQAIIRDLHLKTNIYSSQQQRGGAYMRIEPKEG